MYFVFRKSVGSLLVRGPPLYGKDAAAVTGNFTLKGHPYQPYT
jgi:hypothetical protein